MRTNGGVSRRGLETLWLVLRRLRWFKNALEALQKCPVTKRSTLLLVGHGTVLTTGGMAPDLLT
jgi:hypothetical protein